MHSPSPGSPYRARHPLPASRGEGRESLVAPRRISRYLALMNSPSMQQRRPVMLVVLDGWGWREEAADNAVRQAKTPTFDRLWGQGPHGFLRTSGRDVGLPPGQMGNSEVGHLNIGAGRVVMQDLPRIGDAIASGEVR